MRNGEAGKEMKFGAFITRDVFIKDSSNVDHCDIFYGNEYENWNDLRLGCDVCNECSVGGIKIKWCFENSKPNQWRLFFTQ